MHKITRTCAFGLAGALLVAGLAACGDTDDTADDSTEDTSGPSVSFAAPLDGDEIAGSVPLEMVAEGITIEPAGDVHEGAGHFHVLADAGCATTGEAIAKDADHVHFGKAQTEGRIYLGPGEHELCLQVGDGAHHALDLTDTVTVNVGVRSEEDFCAVAKEVDEQFIAVDALGEDFAATQVAHEGIGRLLAQLQAGLGYTPEEVRADLAESFAFLSGLSSAFTDSATIEEAEAKLGPIYEGANAGQHPAGDAFLLETCGIDVNG